MKSDTWKKTSTHSWINWIANAKSKRFHHWHKIGHSQYIKPLFVRFIYFCSVLLPVYQFGLHPAYVSFNGGLSFFGWKVSCKGYGHAVMQPRKIIMEYNVLFFILFDTMLHMKMFISTWLKDILPRKDHRW